MTGLEMCLMERRLQRAGYRTKRYWYSSISKTLEQNVDRLAEFMERLPGEEIHVVAHSFGGVLTHQYFMSRSGQRPGRIVALGSPFNGCWTARRVAELFPMRRFTLGKSITETMNSPRAPWTLPRDFGVIAGTMPFGLGTFLGSMPGVNDGTVGIEETRLPGATDHIDFPVNHFGLLASDAVAREVNAFLEDGRFQAQTETAGAAYEFPVAGEAEAAVNG
jgi:pimeloyl-ACP methyl ester carboxylesterase